MGALAAFGIAQTGQLDKANGRTHDTISVFKGCEALLKKAAESIQPKPWWNIF